MEYQKELQWTGERLVTQQKDMHFVTEHLHRYALAMQLAENKVVLDIACGEGYGSNLLATVAEKVYGVDIDDNSIKHAQQKYQQFQPEKLKFIQGDATNIPDIVGQVDLIVSFETLEHLGAQNDMLASFISHLKPDGIVIISTPEKTLYQKRSPNNPYHVKELNLNEFQELIHDYFPHTRFFEQRYVFGSCITPLQKDEKLEGFHFFTGDYESILKGNGQDEFYNQPFFVLVMCSLQPLALPKAFGSIFDGATVFHAIQEGHRKTIMDLRERNEKVSSDLVVRLWIRLRTMFFRVWK